MATNKNKDKSKIKIRQSKYLAAIKELENRNGGLITSHMVVDSARDEESPLHNFFEWDNTKAGEKYRLYQARMLMATVRVETVSGGRDEAYYNAIVTVEEIPMRGYVSRDKALTDRNIYQQILRVAARELEYWQRKYESIQQLQGVINREKLEEIKKETL